MKGRGFNKGLFLFVLLTLSLLVICQVLAQEVKERAKFFYISEEKFFRMPIDSISVSKAKAAVNNISYEDAKKKADFRTDINESFKQNKNLYLISIIWYIEHWKFTSNGFIYRDVIIKYVARSGHFMKAESYITEYPIITHIHKKSCGKIERLIK